MGNKRTSVQKDASERPALRWRHKAMFAFLRPPFWLFLRLFWKSRSARYKTASKPPYLIYCNHNTVLDPFIVALCFRFPVFYVASDHIFRLGFVSRLIRYLVSPIPKQKSATDAATVRDILFALRSGASVGLFPEGNRSFTGVTEAILPVAGRLARAAGVPLLLCNIRGGYFTTPRWGKGVRPGRVTCLVAVEISPEKLRSMSAKEINTRIEEVLRVDAYRDNQTGIRYKSRKTAEEAETLLYACPACLRFATLRSLGREGFCSCGLHFTAEETGLLSGAPYATLTEWTSWQRQYLAEYIQAAGEEPLFTDADQELWVFTRAKQAALLGTGMFAMYKNRFTFLNGGQYTFLFSDLQGVEIHGQRVLQFATRDCAYELKSKSARSAYKYFEAWRLCRSEKPELNGQTAALVTGKPV